jgi:hypothetical protein
LAEKRGVCPPLFYGFLLVFYSVFIGFLLGFYWVFIGFLFIVELLDSSKVHIKVGGSFRVFGRVGIVGKEGEVGGYG